MCKLTPDLLGSAIASRVARIEGIDNIESSELPPVQEAIDLDTLANAVRHESVTVAFEYYGYQIVVSKEAIEVL
ncbi:HalOD1 output domain-containing protein [Natronocalculus amylovorans]|uniref:Halobacterial output domain-containing protein n=1 Tax=Natronocalculus amylovorans TaxID=2917812 RepID=A0AAE3FY36_9EURY|nr:HalOD1 output domain-containing protein [Natronocalculus amylovorans]MCL9817434.1 hypothetical protein [Natronocalculus amylovorans]